MSLRMCRQEAAVLTARQTGRWTGLLEEHVRGCSVCTEVLMVETELRREALAPAREPKLPDADSLWYKSRVQAQRLALRPVSIAEHFATACALGVGITVVIALLRAAALT